MNNLNEHQLDQLIKRRLKVMSILISIMVSAYGALVIGMSFFPDFLSESIAQGSLINYGFVLLVFVVLSSIATSYFYIWWMDKKFDPSMRNITKKHY